MTAMPSTVPYGADQTLYLVMDAEGPKGREFHNPVGIFAFNTLEHWTADISKNVAEEILCRCDIEGTPVPAYLEDFVANSLNEVRTQPR
jgi:hypothetical protein